MCCAESQITGSLPLLSDLDVLCEMEHEGQRGLTTDTHLSKDLFFVGEVQVKVFHVGIVLQNVRQTAVHPRVLATNGGGAHKSKINQRLEVANT